MCIFLSLLTTHVRTYLIMITSSSLFSPVRLLNESQSELMAFQGALREYVLSLDAAYGKSYEEFNVGFEGRCVQNLTLVEF